VLVLILLLKRRVAYDNQCIDYLNSFEDSAWLAGKRFSFLSLWCGGASMIFLWVGTFLVLKPGQWKAAGVGVALAFLFQVFSFAWFNTAICHTTSTNMEDFESGNEAAVDPESGPSSCSLYFGSRSSIASTFLYLFAALIILVGPYPVPEPKLIAEENFPMVGAGQSRGTYNKSIRFTDVEMSPRGNLT
jgi:hypothetical protein